ncbi:MAG: ATP-binding protein [Pseudomonadota bacterium]
MGSIADALIKRSIMLWLAATILSLTAIGVGGMMLATLVAERVQGSGSAINVAGSLRRLSHRMGSIVLSDAENNVSDPYVLREALVHFEATLKHDALLGVLRRDQEGAAMQAYEQVTRTWIGQLKPLLADLARPGARAPVEVHNALMLHIDAFVDQINDMVARLEEDTERRIRQLRATLLGALGFMVLVALMGLYLVHRRVIQPLDGLVAGASRVAGGDFSARALHVDQDELGRVGQAFNTMAEAVSQSHRNLEARVQEKTAALTRSNRSLALLYHAISLLHRAPTAPETYRAVLADLDALLGLEGSQACLRAKHGGPATLLASSMEHCDNRGEAGCAECLAKVMAGDGVLDYQPGPRGKLLNLPLRDLDGVYGVIRLALPGDQQLEAWQEQLVEALVRHMGIALGMSRKVEQERLLALQEERSTIARELHDSIAQSLSYMKIQASLMQPLLADPGRADAAAAVLRDLREGINAAYRQLRELLATFRLRMESDFMTLLTAAVEEYAGRGGVPINLDIHLEECRLTPNQEIHVLQIVREALSNVIRHAQARQAWVSLSHQGGVVTVEVEDDGLGVTRTQSGAGTEHFHYGLTIMGERAQGLDGRLDIMDRPEGGTQLRLRFPLARALHQAEVS